VAEHGTAEARRLISFSCQHTARVAGASFLTLCWPSSNPHSKQMRACSKRDKNVMFFRVPLGSPAGSFGTAQLGDFFVLVANSISGDEVVFWIFYMRINIYFIGS
jgi:hypothetical protein